MNMWDFQMALGAAGQRYGRTVDIFLKTGPTWRYIMKKSVKFIMATAALVVTAGLLAVAVLLQSGPQVDPPAWQPVGAQPEEDASSEKWSSSDPSTLLVVSEFATSPMHGAGLESPVYTSLINIAAEYNLSHGDRKVQLQMLPASGTEREIVLQQLRTEIMAGSGPDVFILPAGSVAGIDQNNRPVYGMEGLFTDVERSMRNNIFADLSSYYDQDAELKTEELKQEIMDAGVYDGKRYVLPLGWNMPAVCVNDEKLEETGLDSSLFSSGLCDAYDTILRSENAEAISGAKPSPYLQQLCLFPGVIDYENGTSLLREEDVLTYFQKKKAIREAPRTESFEKAAPNVSTYLNNLDFDFALDGQLPFYCSDLPKCVEMVGIAKAKNIDISVLPIPSSDGTLTAEVTYFGAINAGCAHPEEAYEFLRMFLEPEVQFQQGYDGSSTSLREANCAWPVRIPGSVSAQWEAARKSAAVEKLYENEGTTQRKKELSQGQLSDEDFPVLEETIDHVRFSSPLSYEFAVQSNNLSDPQKAARDFFTQLKYHIAES